MLEFYPIGKVVRLKAEYKEHQGEEFAFINSFLQGTEEGYKPEAILVSAKTGLVKVVPVKDIQFKMAGKYTDEEAFKVG